MAAYTHFGSYGSHEASSRRSLETAIALDRGLSREWAAEIFQEIEGCSTPKELHKALTARAAELGQLKRRKDLEKTALIFAKFSNHPRLATSNSYKILAAIHPIVDKACYRKALKIALSTRYNADLAMLPVIMEANQGALEALSKVFEVLDHDRLREADEWGQRSPLAIAAMRGSVELIEACAPLYSKPKHVRASDIPIKIAVKSGKMQAIAPLVKLIEDAGGEYPLSDVMRIAVLDNHTEAISFVHQLILKKEGPEGLGKLFPQALGSALRYRKAKTVRAVFMVLKDCPEAVQRSMVKSITAETIARIRDPELLDFTLGLFTEDELRKMLVHVDASGNSILHIIASGGDVQCFETFVKIIKTYLGKEALAAAMAPSYRGKTPLHHAMIATDPEIIRAVALQMKALGDGYTLRTIMAEDEGCGLLHSKYHWENRGALIEVIIELWPQHIPLFLRPSMDAPPILHYYVEHGGIRNLMPLLEQLDTAQLVEAMAPWDQCTLFDYHPNETTREALLELLDRLKNWKDVATVLRDLENKALDNHWVQRRLAKRFPGGSQMLKLYLMSQFFCTFGESELLPDEVLPEFIENSGPQPVPTPTTVWKIFTKDLPEGLDNALLSRAAGYSQELAAFFASQKTIPYPPSNIQQGRVYVEQIRFCHGIPAMLISSGYQGKSIKPLLPIVRRLMDLNDAELRTTLVRLMGRHDLTDEKSLADLLQRVNESNGKHAPLLYTIPLAALEKRGVSAPLTQALHKKLASQKAFYEGSRKGVITLNALVRLAASNALDAEDLNSLVDQALKGDFDANLSAIAQILYFRRDHLLKNVSGQNLREVAERCFRDIIPVGKVEDTLGKYESCIASQRDPGSLISYASKMSMFPKVCDDLGRFLTMVFDGSFHTKRYAASASEQMKKLYEAKPSLATQLPSLCKDMGSRLIGDGKGGMGFTFDEEQISDRVLEDNQLPEEQFPFIHDFLTAKKGKERQGVRKALGQERSKLAKKKPRSKEEELAYLRLVLQEQLIGLCCHEDPQTLRRLLIRAIATAKSIPGISSFRTAMNNAKAALAQSETAKVADFSVSLSDHYWDLLRIGTDIIGSCQSMHGKAQYNRNLLGYVLNGYVMPIIVKKPGSDATQARRLLMFTLDKEGKPALYLERLYANMRVDAIDQAIIGMAKAVSQRLQIPLYSALGGSKVSGPPLQILGNAASCIYSDAGGGSCEREVHIGRSSLLYQPGTGPVCSTSGSS